MSKIKQAERIIDQALSISKKPVVCCSFGKDSLSVLKMVQDRLPKVDVLFLPEIELHHKNLHGYKAAVEMKVGNLYSYPPSFVDYIQKGNYFEVLKYHYVDGVAWYVLYNGCRQYVEGENFLCAEKELLSSINTVPSYSFPWDCIIHGQKEIDSVHFTDKYKFKAPIIQFGKGVMAAPIYNWNDQEALNYATMRELPIQKDRYVDNPSGLSTGKPNQDLISSDVIPTCFKCLDYRQEGQEIICPRTGETVEFCGRKKEIHKITLNAMLKASGLVV